MAPTVIRFTNRKSLISLLFFYVKKPPCVPTLPSLCHNSKTCLLCCLSICYQYFRYSYGTEVVDDGPLTVGSFKADNGDIISHLNITQARTKYGGIYDCVATSKVGSVSHTGKLNIFGAPFIRKMDPMKVVAGKSMAITCPVAGHPISRIVWERGNYFLKFRLIIVRY